MAELLFYLNSFLLHFVFQSTASLLFQERFLNYFKGFNVFLHEFHSVRSSVCLLHVEIFQRLLQLGCGSTVTEMGSVHSCFPSSTNLIWIKNGHLISFMESTVAPCWLLGNHHKVCWFKVNPSDFFLSALKQQSQIVLRQHDFHSVIGALKLDLWPCHTYFCQIRFS